MKSDLVHSLTHRFEDHAHQTGDGVEFWLARDIQHLLGYTEWRNFTAVLFKAKTACEVSGHTVPDHFRDVTKMVERRLSSADKKALKTPDTLDKA